MCYFLNFYLKVNLYSFNQILTIILIIGFIDYSFDFNSFIITIVVIITIVIKKDYTNTISIITNYITIMTFINY